MFMRCMCHTAHVRSECRDDNTEYLSIWDADKGKKSRFRQLTDLVKSGMSAATSRATSRANSRAPSRGVTQDLEGFEITQAAVEPVNRSQATQAANQKSSTSPTLTEGQSRESANDKAFSRPVAEGHAHSSPANSTYAATISEFAEILAAQPSRSASSAALLNSYQQAQQSIHVDTTQVKATDRHIKDSARPIAEGTEARQPVNPPSGANPKPSPKMGAGFMSGASTGRGATAQSPAAATAAAAAARARPSGQEPESDEAFPDNDMSTQE